MIEALAQAATLLLLDPSTHSSSDSPHSNSLRAGAFGNASCLGVQLRGVDGAKFRKHVTPGDQLKLIVTLGASRGPLVKATAVAEVDGQTVVEAELLLAVSAIAHIDPLARVAATAVVEAGTSVGPFAVVGPHVRIGKNCKIGASAVIEGHTTIGESTEVFPYASIGLAPQDLKYRGEPTRLEIGAGNIFREFVTIHRGTAGGGGVTTIGDGNLFMNYVHVAHDCHVGNNTIFGPHATLGGHVSINDYVNVSAGSAVHQFCRVGVYAFIGGYSVITKDALPYGRTVGSRPARVFGLNLIGLKRRGFADDTLKKLRTAYRYLTQSKLNTTQAIEKIEADGSLKCPEVDTLVEFIRTASRGVILRRGGKKTDDSAED
jgi:UDP-N-acetylglucosamine acyltransferase